MKSKIVIVDYGLGNLRSVENAFKYLGKKTLVSSLTEDILSADFLVLPGVGSFSLGAHELDQRNLRKPILEYIKRRKPFLGICLGMQLMFEDSEESPNAKGLGIFKGTVKLIPAVGPAKLKRKIPHIGWSQLQELNSSPIIQFNNPKTKDAYFLHSYAVHPQDNSIINTVSDYNGLQICASISEQNVFGCQFHPEKSAKFGLEIISHFLNLQI